MRFGEEGEDEDDDAIEAALGGSYVATRWGRISIFLGDQETKDHMENMLLYAG